MAEQTAKLTILATLKDDASAAMQRLGNYASDLGGQMGFAADKSGILASGLAAIGGSAVLSAINAFNSAQEKVDRAKGIFEGLPDGINKFTQALEFGNEAQKKFGFDNETVTLGLAQFARAAGGNMTLALSAMQAAMGLAVDRNVDLGTAIQQLMPTFAGGGRAVKALGIDIDEHASAQTAFAAVIKATATELDAYGKSATTQGKILKANLGDTLENMGQPLATALNGIQGLINPLLAVANSSQITQPALQGMGVSLALVSTYVALLNGPAMLTKLLTTLGLLATGTELTLGAIISTIAVFAFWVIVIGLVIGAIILLVTHWSEIWAKVKELTADGVAYVKELLLALIDAWNHLPELIGAAIGYLVVVVVNGFVALGNMLAQTVPALLAQLVSWFAGLPGAIAGALSSIPGMLVSVFQQGASAIRGVIDSVISYIANAPNSLVSFGKSALNSMVTTLNQAINGFNGVAGAVGIHLPTIPAFASGGIVTGPTIGLIGEAGPEAIVPLSQAGRYGLGGGSGGINIYFQGDVYSTREVAEQFANEVAFLIKNQLNLAGVRA